MCCVAAFTLTWSCDSRLQRRWWRPHVQRSVPGRELRARAGPGLGRDGRSACRRGAACAAGACSCSCAAEEHQRHRGEAAGQGWGAEHRRHHPGRPGGQGRQAAGRRRGNGHRSGGLALEVDRGHERIRGRRSGPRRQRLHRADQGLRNGSEAVTVSLVRASVNASAAAVDSGTPSTATPDSSSVPEPRPAPKNYPDMTDQLGARTGSAPPQRELL